MTTDYLAEIAYRAAMKAHNQEVIMPYDKLPEDAKNAWRAAACAVRNVILECQPQ